MREFNVHKTFGGEGYDGPMQYERRVFLNTWASNAMAEPEDSLDNVIFQPNDGDMITERCRMFINGYRNGSIRTINTRMIAIAGMPMMMIHYGTNPARYNYMWVSAQGKFLLQIINKARPMLDWFKL